MVRAEHANDLRAVRDGHGRPERAGVLNRVAEQQVQAAAIRVHGPQSVSGEDTLFDAVVPAREQHAAVVQHLGRLIAVDIG
jgi:hypothetical protein